jgi:hypothetical protein
VNFLTNLQKETIMSADAPIEEKLGEVAVEEKAEPPKKTSRRTTKSKKEEVAAPAPKKEEVEEILKQDAEEQLASLVQPYKGEGGDELAKGFSLGQTKESAVNSARRNVEHSTADKKSPKSPYSINVGVRKASNPGAGPTRTLKSLPQTTRTGVHIINKDKPVNSAQGTHRE